MAGHTAAVLALAVLADRALVSCGGDGALRLWSSRTGALESELSGGHAAPIRCATGCAHVNCR